MFTVIFILLFLFLFFCYETLVPIYLYQFVDAIFDFLVKNFNYKDNKSEVVKSKLLSEDKWCSGCRGLTLIKTSSQIKEFENVLVTAKFCPIRHGVNMTWKWWNVSTNKLCCFIMLHLHFFL